MSIKVIKYLFSKTIRKICPILNNFNYKISYLHEIQNELCIHDKLEKIC